MTSHPKVIQPQGLDIQLFPHQLALIYKMELLENQQVVEGTDLYKETRLGINADPTGSGKTLSMIGLIIRDKMEWNMDSPHIIETITYEGGGWVKNVRVQRFTRLKATLILLSPTLISQWDQELTHSKLKVEIVLNRRDVDHVDPMDSDVIMVIPTMYNSLMASHSKHVWKRFIFDEPGHTRVSGMKEIQAGFNWFVTATPNAIGTHHGNCKGSIMKNIVGSSDLDFNTQFRGMIINNDKVFIDQSFKLPMVEYQDHHCFQPILSVVDGLVNSTIKTLIESGNIAQAILSLGGSTTNNIVEVIRTKKEILMRDIQEKIDCTKDTAKIQELQGKLTHTGKQIDELHERFRVMLTDTCHICMEPLINPVLEPHCHNLFCGKCLLNWLHTKDNCPLCRNTIRLEDLIHVESLNTTIPRKNITTRLQTKAEVIIQIITSNKKGKFIIFSSHDGSFAPICKILNDHGIEWVEVSGTSSRRHKSIEKFRQGSCNVIFLNSRLSSAGINLPETTDIILYHEMHPTTKHQIIGRAQRIGRDDILHIHNLK